jgi:hypothetical protein
MAFDGAGRFHHSVQENILGIFQNVKKAAVSDTIDPVM